MDSGGPIRVGPGLYGPPCRPSSASPGAAACPSTTLRRLGHRIPTLRLAKRWTQEDLAAEGGLDRSYASGLESGRRNATCLRLPAVAKALNVSVQSFSMCSC
ncbi:MAG: helix-turn-helix domain-containing protein [Dehalococcoidia bacterium]